VPRKRLDGNTRWVLSAFLDGWFLGKPITLETLCTADREEEKCFCPSTSWDRSTRVRFLLRAVLFLSLRRCRGCCC
jgi:hypothetical protein